MLSGGTHRRALPRYQREKIQILNISFFGVGIEPTTCLRQDDLSSRDLMELSNCYWIMDTIGNPSVIVIGSDNPSIPLNEILDVMKELLLVCVVLLCTYTTDSFKKKLKNIIYM